MSGADRLRLRPPRLADEAAFLAAQRALAAESFDFGLGYDADRPWPEYVSRVNRWRCGQDLPDGWVASTFLLATVDGVVVGRSSIRHELTSRLRREGGHIGYAVLPAHRRRGYATAILRQSLIIARAVGVDPVLVTCDDDNAASAAVIERCGGVLASVGPSLDRDVAVRRYWIG